MSNPGQTQAPSPDLFFETLNAHQRTAALKGALDLELFTAIGEGAHTVDAIAARIGGQPRATRILCDFLTVAGFLTKDNGNYALTQDSALFLDKRSPAYMGSVANLLLSPLMIDSFRDLSAVVRNGRTLLEGDGTVEPDHPIWQEFARSMVPMMALPAQLIAKHLHNGDSKPVKVLDIAAGHGLFGIEIAKLNPKAHIHALDWPKVLDVAGENARAAGVHDRHHRLEGNAFDIDFGNNYDIVLLTNFLHHFDVATCEKLLRKIHAALNPGGRCATLEFVPNSDRVSPPIPATFAMIMLANTAAGDAYTFDELHRMAANAGFARSEIRDLLPNPQHLVVSHK
jgi:2-polyprenyl-3-methyl-5-hydroxy-6-metoxy-1,4-benzoquinol methylase